MGIDGKDKADVFDEYFEKQIIIDGVDISECTFCVTDIIKDKCELCCKILQKHGEFNTECAKYPNCYYKQLQRLKAAKYYKLINAPCKIKPFENLDGLIIAVYITKKGIEYQVRYYLNGEQRTDYFFDWEVEIKEA